MQMQKRILVKRCVLLAGVCSLAVITFLFFVGEELLADGWYYIPDRAITVSLVLCFLWQGVLAAGAWLLSRRLSLELGGFAGTAARVVVFAAAVFLVLVLAGNWLIYSFKFEEKVEQYDAHIALYVKNTFVRVEHRDPHYRYEESWLLMRRLRDDEAEAAVRRYGDPDNYYR